MIRITSDSTCDLGELVKKHGIALMPLKVILDTESFKDGVDIAPKDIFAFVAKTKMLPKTSAPSIEDFVEFFTRQLKDADEVIHFTISSKASASYSCAATAAKEFGGRVRVVDSYALSSGQGLLVMKAIDLLGEGKSAAEIEETVNALKEKVNTSFVPDRQVFENGNVRGEYPQDSPHDRHEGRTTRRQEKISRQDGRVH